MTFHRSLIASCAAALVVAACSDPPPAPPPPAPKKAAAPAKEAPAQAAESETPPVVYVYSPLNKRDPFRSPLEDERVIERVSGPCAEPLCQFDLDQLKLVAVVTGDANPIAMVTDPMGRGHIIRRNSRMGRQGGKVTQILRDSVTITEYWQGNDGKVTPNQATLKLKEDPRGQPAVDLLTGQLVQ